MRVIGGRYEGDTGLIVRVEENMVVLFSDLTMHELKTLPKVSINLNMEIYQEGYSFVLGFSTKPKRLQTVNTSFILVLRTSYWFQSIGNVTTISKIKLCLKSKY